MSRTANPNEDPAITGVPPETPEAVRPSATGLVVGPIDDETHVEVAHLGSSPDHQQAESPAIDQILDDAAGAVEASAAEDH